MELGGSKVVHVFVSGMCEYILGFVMGFGLLRWTDDLDYLGCLNASQRVFIREGGGRRARSGGREVSETQLPLRALRMEEGLRAKEGWQPWEQVAGLGKTGRGRGQPSPGRPRGQPWL